MGGGLDSRADISGGPFSFGGREKALEQRAKEGLGHAQDKAKAVEQRAMEGLGHAQEKAKDAVDKVMRQK